MLGVVGVDGRYLTIAVHQTDDLAVLLFVLKKVWGEVSDDVKSKAQDKLKKWFDEDEIPSADDLFKDSATDTPV